MSTCLLCGNETNNVIKISYSARSVCEDCVNDVRKTASAAVSSLSGQQEAQGEWIELKEGCEMPDYDEYVLWLMEDGNMNVEALDKDGNPWIFGEEWMGTKLPKATHWRLLPSPPSKPNK